MADMHETGLISVWIATEPPSGKKDVDVYQDLCGIEFYDLDYGEGNASDDGEPIPVEDLLRPLSFSDSFINVAVARAKELGIEQGRWCSVLYDFTYDPAKAVRPIAPDPKFIGYFPYVPDPLPDWAR